MKRHAPKTPKNTKVLRELLWARGNRSFWQINGKPLRIKSAKGKTGFTLEEAKAILRSGRIGRIEGMTVVE